MSLIMKKRMNFRTGILQGNENGFLENFNWKGHITAAAASKQMDDERTRKSHVKTPDAHPEVCIIR